MKPTMKLGDFLTAYLKRIGVDHLFGIPGDMVIKLFLNFGKRRGLKIITFSHEPGVGFAADGYARSTGKLGVVCVTYGAGGHNMVNPVAGSFSEKVPILVISGGPGEEERKLGVLIHHQAKEIESQFHIYKELTCAARIINRAETAAEQIDEVIRQIWLERRPGYLEIRRDQVDLSIPVPKRIREWSGHLPRPRSDPQKVREAAQETAKRFNAAKAPVMIVGIEVQRFRLMREVVALADKMGVPVLTNVLAKGAFPMDHPLSMGIYVGPLSHPAVQKRVHDDADLVISLGTLLTDMDLGSDTPKVPQAKSIWAVGDRVNISYHSYNDVYITDFIHALLKTRITKRSQRVSYYDNLSSRPKNTVHPITIADVLRALNTFLAKKRNYMVVTESGDALFAGIDIKVSCGGIYLAQGYYGSMGFAVPGALGAQIGTGHRPVVLCGDGGFQMTGPEVAQAKRYGLNPIIVLLNNGGWGIFRHISKRTDLLSLPDWRYADLATLWGGTGMIVEKASQMLSALEEAAKTPTFVIIEVKIPPNDLSPMSRKYIEAAARHSNPASSRKK